MSQCCVVLLLNLTFFLLFAQTLIKAQDEENADLETPNVCSDETMVSSYNILKSIPIDNGDTISTHLLKISITEYQFNDENIIQFNITNKETNYHYYTVIDSAFYKKYAFPSSKQLILFIQTALKDESNGVEIQSIEKTPHNKLYVKTKTDKNSVWFAFLNVENVIFELQFITPTFEQLLNMVYTLSSEMYHLKAQQKSAMDIINSCQINSYQGLKGWFKAKSFDVSKSQWNDISNAQNHVYKKQIAGNVRLSGETNNDIFDYIYGGVNDYICFPDSLYLAKPDYTLIHVAKYNGNNRGRIFNSRNSNWLSGFLISKSGIAYHETWITQSAKSIHGDKWVVSVDQLSLYRSNGITRSTIDKLGSYASSKIQLCINNGRIKESSDWAVAEVLIFDKLLNMNQIMQIESHLIEKYL